MWYSLFLLYINDITNSSDKLSFRFFADDTIIFLFSSNTQKLETTINCELIKVKERSDCNKLSINLKKTNYMRIKSAQKRNVYKLPFSLPDKILD